MEERGREEGERSRRGEREKGRTDEEAEGEVPYSLDSSWSFHHRDRSGPMGGATRGSGRKGPRQGPRVGTGGTRWARSVLVRQNLFTSLHRLTRQTLTGGLTAGLGTCLSQVQTDRCHQTQEEGPTL